MSFKSLVTFAAGIIICFAARPSFPATWNLLGLEDRAVNCLLARDTTLILAGTSRGISVYWKARWYDAYSGLPVKALTWSLQGTDVIAAAGSGTYSDGIYIGKSILNGPPFYQFTVRQYCVLPNVLAVQTAVSGKDTGMTVYTGSENAISSALFVRDTLFPLAKVPLPAYAFGIEMPVCAALHIFRMNGMLFAGGYDASPMAGSGALLQKARDSMQFVNRMSVTAMMESSFTPGPSIEVLFIGTKDTGCFWYNPTSSAWTSLGAPAKEPVTAVSALPRAIMAADFPVAAVASGVFTYNGFSAGGTWTEMGDIPKSPVCMIVSPFRHGSTQPTIMAGTGAGVYEYAEPPARVVEKPRAFQNSFMSYADGAIRVRTEERDPGQTEITVLALNGKRHFTTRLRTSAAVVPFNEKGIYLCVCRVRGKTVQTVTIANFK